MEATSQIPFELVLRGESSWRGRWEKLGIEVAGTADAPDPVLLATLADVVARWAETQETIATYLRGLAAGHHVPLSPASIGGFAARNCGFDGELFYQSIEVTAPHRVEVTFYTGYPDGYATYLLILDRGVPIDLSSFAS